MQQEAERHILTTKAVPRPATVTEEEIRDFLTDLSSRGRSRHTVRMYTARLRSLWGYLPQEKLIYQDTLANWQKSLLYQGYSHGTVNTYLAAANGLLEHMGRRELQLVGQLDVAPETLPELSRTEYLRLLQTARTLHRERAYLLIKVFALIGIRVGELTLVTAEAVKSGRLFLTSGGEQRYVPIPTCLRQELSGYMARQGIDSGPVFITRSKRVLQRAQVNAEIQALGRDARVSEGKCNPRCLRKLCQATRADIERGVRLLAEQSYERMLDMEQMTIGWDGA